MRLVTRGDLDGVTSSVLITTMEDISSIELTHPQEITNKNVVITGDDILVNLPYHPKAGMWFDHHEFTQSNERPPAIYRGRHAMAPSAARVVYDHYATERLEKYDHLVRETDRFDAAQLTKEDIVDPADVILIGYTIDSRSGIGSFKDYFKRLVEWLKTSSAEEVLQQPEVVQRVKLLRNTNKAFLDALRQHSRLDGNVVITDFRPLERPPVGNRFLVYTLFPASNVSVRIQWGPEKRTVAVSIGHNILNRTSRANCGLLCGDYGGGGHRGAGSFPVSPSEANRVVGEIVGKLKAAG